MTPVQATRSKKSIKQAGPKSKVTKKPFKSAPKAAKAKKITKAKTSPPREEVLVSTTSSDTLTPNEVEETPPPPARVDLDELIAQLSKVQDRRDRHHSHKDRSDKSRSRRHHRRHRHRYSNTSDSDSSDSKSDHERRRGVPFRHSKDKKPFLSIAQKYSSVEVKYFIQIFFETFQTKNFAKLAHMHTTPASDRNKNVSGHNHMMHYFHVYVVAIGRFAHLSVKEELNEALHSYAIRLLRLSITYRFESILAYHFAFVTGQDVPTAWEADDQSCRDLLVPKGAQTSNSKSDFDGSGFSKSAPRGATDSCRMFNRGSCIHERCIYSHVCLICQQNHSAV